MGNNRIGMVDTVTMDLAGVLQGVVIRTLPPA